MKINWFLVFASAQKVINFVKRRSNGKESNWKELWINWWYGVTLATSSHIWPQIGGDSPKWIGTNGRARKRLVICLFNTANRAVIPHKKCHRFFAFTTAGFILVLDTSRFLSLCFLSHLLRMLYYFHLSLIIISFLVHSSLHPGFSLYQFLCLCPHISSVSLLYFLSLLPVSWCYPCQYFV